MGSKSMPEEPDYTKELAGYARSEFADRQREAAKYNRGITNYNTRLSGIDSQSDALTDQLGNLSIVDDELFDDYLGQMSDLEKNYNRLTSSRIGSMDEPIFNSTVSSPYGVVEVKTPRLSHRNEGLAMDLAGALSSGKSTIERLRAARTAEEKRIDDYNSMFSSQMAGLGSSIGDLTIADLAGINSRKQQLNELLSGVSGFSSEILGEYRPDLISSATARIGSEQDRLNQLLTQRTAEENRIKAYEQNLNSGYDSLNSVFSGLGVADEAGMNALQADIDARQLEAGRFSTTLGYDFNQELDPYADLESRLGALRNKRASELGRVDQAQNQANNGLSSINSMLGNADIYNLGMLNQLGSAISQGRNDISSFTSGLPSNFSNVLSGLEGADAQLASLRERRQQALGGFSTQAQSLIDQINGYDLTNENGLNTGYGQAQQLLSRLGQFSGSDLTDVRAAVQAAVDRAGGRINDLGQERSTIENEARGLLTGARTTDYTESAQLDELANQIKALTGRTTSYGATQAQDELDALSGLVSSQRGRLSADAAAALERQKQEQAAYGQMPAYGSTAANYYQGYSPWGGGGGFSSSYFPGQLPTSFARQLGVIYA